LGWDPIGEVYSKLGNRERWPIPWLEDDPSMWFPQFRASHIQSDMQRARELGCQGMLGIHWRNRVVDPTATYFARAAWNESLTSAQNYRYYCETQAVGARATELATIFEDADRHRLILSTFLGTYDKNGFAMTNDITADYVEAFIYDDSEPELTVLDSQRATASKLRELTARATSPLERDRIGYFSGFVNMMVPYSDAFETAHKIGAFMKQAVALREQKKEADARTIVMDNAVPLWLKMAPMVRDTMLTYQAVVTTRNDQGQLASMQNKFVRIALERLRLSIKEFVDELPPAMDAAYAAAISPASANPQRLFMPTRPSLLNVGDSVRIFIVAPGQADVTDVKLYTRRLGEQQWKSVSADHAGRAVYAAQLGPFQASDATIEYYAAAPGNPSTMSAPPQAPVNLYTLNILHS
jgi:hypothetical protein